MFGVFLKAKLDLEGKINSLERIYVDLLRAPICELRYNKTNDGDKALSIVREKLELLEKIKEEYSAALETYSNLTNEIAEAKEIVEDVELQLDCLFEAFAIEIPEDLKYKNKSPEARYIKPPTPKSPAEEEEDKENTQIFGEEEEDEGSDKENSRSRVEQFSDSGSGEYFSPNVHIRKSFKDNNVDCYTPAIKSHSKVPILRRKL